MRRDGEGRKRKGTIPSSGMDLRRAFGSSGLATKMTLSLVPFIILGRRLEWMVRNWEVK